MQGKPGTSSEAVSISVVSLRVDAVLVLVATEVGAAVAAVIGVDTDVPDESAIRVILT